MTTSRQLKIAEIKSVLENNNDSEPFSTDSGEEGYMTQDDVISDVKDEMVDLLSS